MIVNTNTVCLVTTVYLYFTTLIEQPKCCPHCKKTSSDHSNTMHNPPIYYSNIQNVNQSIGKYIGTF